MPTTESTLVDLAVRVHELASGPAEESLRLPKQEFGDPVLNHMPLYHSYALTHVPESLAEAAAAMEGDPSLAALRATEGGAPFVALEMSGGKYRLSAMPHRLIEAAYQRMYVFSLDKTADTLTGLVLAGLDDLRRVAAEEPVGSITLRGIAGVEVVGGLVADLPWGQLRPVPEPLGFTGATWVEDRQVHTRPTSAILVEERTFTPVVSRDPGAGLDPVTVMAAAAQRDRINLLLPFAFALASDDTEPCGPVITFETMLPPAGGFRGLAMHAVDSLSPYSFEVSPTTISAIVEWATRLDTSHVPSLDVTARRVVSAIAGRDPVDRTDALIDSVTAWENLVGCTPETTFRVTAALTKLLVAAPGERIAERSRMSKLYQLRSKVVHGQMADLIVLDRAATDALAIAIRAARALYERGEPWLSMKSDERATRLILDAEE